MDKRNFYDFTFFHSKTVNSFVCYLSLCRPKGFWPYSPQNTCLLLNIKADNIRLKKIPGITPKITLSALLSFGPDKRVGFNILGMSALIFLALVP